MDDKATRSLREKINQLVLNTNCDFEIRSGQFIFGDKQFLLEQYKLLIESGHKIEERRGNSARLYLTINTLLVSSLVGVTVGIIQLKFSHALVAPVFVFLTLVGIAISYNWLIVMTTYKIQNLLNYYLVQAIEKYLPARVFSLFVELEANKIGTDSVKKANAILVRENLLPIMFMITYSAFLFYGLGIFILRS